MASPCLTASCFELAPAGWCWLAFGGVDDEERLMG